MREALGTDIKHQKPGSRSAGKRQYFYYNVKETKKGRDQQRKDKLKKKVGTKKTENNKTKRKLAEMKTRLKEAEHNPCAAVREALLAGAKRKTDIPAFINTIERADISLHTKPLGEGTFGKVTKGVVTATGLHVAVKSFIKTPHRKPRLRWRPT